MKIKKNLRSFILLWIALLLSQSIMAQQDTTQLRFSEEAITKDEKKNMKWVGINANKFEILNVSSMYKVGVSTFSTYTVSGSFSFEVSRQHKFKKTQLSIEPKLRANWYVGDNSLRQITEFIGVGNGFRGIAARNDVSFDVVFRYQPFKTGNALVKNVGNNLYGFYLYGGVLNLLAWQKQRVEIFRPDITLNQPFKLSEKRAISSNSLILTGGIGYQVRFLKRGYFDFFSGVSRFRNDFSNLGREFHLQLAMGLGYTIFKVKK